MTVIVQAGVRVLHGFVAADGALCLWGESDMSREFRRGSGHPFAIERDRLPAGEDLANVTLVLPSTSAGPLPSPQLGLSPRRGTPRPRSWHVPAVSVPFVDDDLADEFDGRVGHSARWLIEVCAFAADLVRRGRVLPSVLPDGHAAGGRRPVARWRPVLTGFDAIHHGDLLRRMPAACRAATGGLPAADVLALALHRLVDGLVRTRLAVAGVEIGDGWLAALTGEPTFTAAPALADKLAERLDAWHASAASGAAVRLCFRLSRIEELDAEPDATDPHAAGLGRDAWLLEFLLQAVDEPSALVTAADI